ncbi:nuclease-related domain-containing protein [Streptomyces sp. NPDC052236]|uniref:nuclease-related domain-containing protein n=1 Tax=Streptomyces sp. NPDC052236 TaxID=3365686 RepID=UPI0037CF7088
MTGLRVTPAHIQGRDRLYVSLPNGRKVAWYDHREDGGSGRVSLVSERHRDDVLAALAPYLTGEVTIGPPPVPGADDLARLSLHPDDDLAPNRPGEALHAELDDLPDRRGFGFASGLASGFGFRTDPRRAELAAQELLGDALDQLEGAGWRLLHSVALPGAERIDHLAIGPAGVLAVHTLAARRLRVRIADPMVRVGHGEPSPRLRLARRCAGRAALALTAGVSPLLAVVGAARVEVEGAPPEDVRILREDEVPEQLGRLGGVLKPADIEALYATARDRRTWLRV